MRKNVRYHYYVEGNCEKKLIDEFKKQQLPIIAGKIDVFNAIQEEFSNTRLRMLPENTVVILVFDTDTGIVETLFKNLEILKRHPHVKETWCVMQVHNLEDEIKRSKQIVYRGCFLLKDVNSISGAFVFIDEPEISMHPNWQSRIMDYYKGIKEFKRCY